MRRTLVALAAALAVLLPGAPAWAHNRLTGSDPAADATVATAPASVTLTFLGNLKPGFTTIVVTDAARRRIPAADPVVSGTAGTVTLSQELANGVHTVAYRAVSEDGHIVQGAYTFTVADPAKPAPAAVASAPAATPPAAPATAPATAPAAAPAAAPAEKAGGIPGPVLIILAGIGLALGGLALVLRLRVRASS